MKPLLLAAALAAQAPASAPAASPPPVLPANAAGKAAAPSDKQGDKPTVYVDEIKADKALANEATALTTSLCTALSKSRSFEVACAPDIKQLLGFAATAGLMGLDQSTSGKVEERLAKATHVVTGTLRKDGAAYVLVLSTALRSEESQGVVIVPGKALWSSEERGDSSKAVLAKLDGAATKIAAAVEKR